MSKIKAITVHEPYVSFLVSSQKRYETRSWDTKYRGLIAIHAGKTWGEGEQENAKLLHQRFPDLPLIESPQLGAVLGICRLIECHPTASLRGQVSKRELAVGDWRDGRFAWEMEVLEVFPFPIAVNGKQGLWEWEMPEEFLSKRVAIVGSRDYEDLAAVKRYVYSLPLDTTIISGGARGVDKAAEDAAKERGMRTVILNVNTRGLSSDNEIKRREQFAQRAMWRNGEIVALAGSVVAFWDEKSNGTRDTIQKAEKLGKQVMINPSVEEKPKQLEFVGFSSTYDEGAQIDYLLKNKKLVEEENKKKEEPFVWSSPWLTKQDTVWVWDGWTEGKRNFRLVPKDSEAAELQSRFLRGFFYSSNTQELIEWLEYKSSWQKTPGYIADVGDLDAGYALRSGSVEEDVPLKHIILTQDTFNEAIRNRYINRFTEKDALGKLPYGVRFGDSEDVYVLDGTHRTLAARRLEHETLKLEVNSFPESFAQACGYIAFDEEAESLAKAEFFADVLREALEILNQESQEKELEYV